VARTSMRDVSTILGAPPHHWKPAEVAQMKAIQEAYRASIVASLDDDEAEAAADLVNLTENSSFINLVGAESIVVNSRREESGEEIEGLESADNEGGAAGVTRPTKDPENFLPHDSVLRSKNGDGKEPEHVPFKDYQAFVASNNFQYWKSHFRGQSQDRMLSEIAQSTVSHICTAQATGELRVRHGSVPLGKILRKKREHITPLALCLHEIKMWATNWLRSASVYEKSTYRTLERRVRYLELLQRKEVWGSAALPLQSGMRPVAHDKLFRLLLTAKEDLQRARNYAFRGYSRRASREKLARLGNLLKDVLLHEMRVISGLFSMTQKLSDPKTRTLQPTDFLSSWKNHTFVDYTNIANVCLQSLCEVPLVRAALMSDYDSEDVQTSLVDIGHWSQKNLFCLPPKDGRADPVYLFDDSRESGGLLPEVYSHAASNIKFELNKVDPHQPSPLTMKKQLHLLKKAFKNDGIVFELMKHLLTCLAALQDMIPSMYISNELWQLAGQGGDFVLYELLREQVVGIMQNSLQRVKAVQEATSRLVKFFHRVVRAHESAMERRRLVSRKSNYQPPWVSNFYHIKHDQLNVSRKAFTQAYLQIWEVARDAWEYDLSEAEITARVENLRGVCSSILGDSNPKPGSLKGRFNTSALVKQQRPNWLNLTYGDKNLTHTTIDKTLESFDITSDDGSDTEQQAFLNVGA